jgi:hypothetical protein
MVAAETPRRSEEPLAGRRLACCPTTDGGFHFQMYAASALAEISKIVAESKQALRLIIEPLRGNRESSNGVCAPTRRLGVRMPNIRIQYVHNAHDSISEAFRWLNRRRFSGTLPWLE